MISNGDLLLGQIYKINEDIKCKIYIKKVEHDSFFLH